MDFSLIKLCSYSARHSSLFFCIQSTLGIAGVILGVLLIRWPKKTIETQMSMYRFFNWKLEPVSMEKEIRNMRLMGMAVFIFGVFSMVYLLFIK